MFSCSLDPHLPCHSRHSITSSLRCRVGLGSSHEIQEIAVVRRLATTNKMNNTRQNVSQFRRLGGRWFWRVIGTVYDAANNGSTLVANINSRASNELRNFVLILTAEGTMKKLSKEHDCFLQKREKSSIDDILPRLLGSIRPTLGMGGRHVNVDCGDFDGHLPLVSFGRRRHKRDQTRGSRRARSNTGQGLPLCAL